MDEISFDLEDSGIMTRVKHLDQHKWSLNGLEFLNNHCLFFNQDKLLHLLTLRFMCLLTENLILSAGNDDFRRIIQN